MLDPPRTEHSWDPYGDPRDAVATAGAYVVLGGRFAFMLGLSPDGERLAVIRLGGHCESGETPWQCAERELVEEAGLRISPRTPPCTYWLQLRDEQALEHGAPVAGSWPSELDAPIGQCAQPESTVPAPLLVARGFGAHAQRLSATYLAHAEGTPEPLDEADGLLLLTPAEVLGILSRPITLHQYLRSGGHAILRPDLPLDLPLDPYLQLRVLPALLSRHPDLAT